MHRDEPDLVVLTGDVISGKGVDDPAAGGGSVKPVVERGMLGGRVWRP